MPSLNQQLEEYAKLKEEQVARIIARDSLLNYDLVALAAVGAIAASLKRPGVAMLLCPWISSVFGWAYVQHEEKISSIGRYLRKSHGDGAYPWELESKHMTLNRGFHRAVSCIMLLTAFAIPSIVGPTWWLHTNNSPSIWLTSAAIAEVMLGVLISIVILLSARLLSEV